MHTLIVLPGVTPLRRNVNYILVDSKDFTSSWCCKCIAGMQFDNVEIWASDDPEATAWAMSRHFGKKNNTGTILLTKSVWEALESLYQMGNMEQKHIDAIKASCNIVEDLK